MNHAKLKKIIIIQPDLFDYRRLVYNRLSEYVELIVVTDKLSVSKEACEFRIIQLDTIRCRGLIWKKRLIKTVLAEKPDALWIAASLSEFSSVLLTLIMRFTKTKSLLHGQGLVRRCYQSRKYKFLLSIWLLFSDQYIAYERVGMDSMSKCAFSSKKLTYINNRFEDLPTKDLDISRQETLSIMFVGRIRKGSNLGLLIEALRIINEESTHPIELHVVGDGVDAELEVWSSINWLFCHGAIHNPIELKEIASLCSLGVYPGDAGLSILTYMKYKLPVICHNDFRHNGPETSYITPGYDGWHFKRNNLDSLVMTLRKALFQSDLDLFRLNAVTTFNSLHSTSYAKEMYDAVLATIEVTNNDSNH